jgi:transglutaminase-like putative cysteine protease/MFS family permease
MARRRRWQPSDAVPTGGQSQVPTGGQSPSPGGLSPSPPTGGLSPSPPTTRRNPVPPTALGDLLALAVMLAAAVLSWGPVFGDRSGYQAAGGGVLLGLALAAGCARLRLPALITALVTVVGYLLFGGALALPGTTIAGVIPTPTTLVTLLVQSVHAWKDLLTIRPPTGSFTGPAVAPLIAGLLSAVIALSLAWRTRFAVAALIPVATLLITGILWGTDEAPFARWQGLVSAVTALIWTAWRAGLRRAEGEVAIETGDDAADLTPSRGLRVRRGVGALLLLGLAGGAAMVATAVTAPPHRTVLRERVLPPLDLHEYPSPLTGFRFMETEQKDDVLLTVDGLPKGARVALATVDSYDGIVYNVTSGSTGSGGFARVGEQIDELDAAVPLQISIGDYRGVWVPAGGEVTSVVFEGAMADNQGAGLFYNADTTTLLTTARVGEGTRYTVNVVPLVEPTPAQLKGRSPASVRLPELGILPEAVTGQAADYVGAASAPFEQLTAMETKFRSDGFYSDGTKDGSRPGHTVERIDTLLTAPQMVGDDEQYAVAMALMARQLGLPARVVMGFYPEQYTDGPIELTGADAHVWVEVAFDDVGWVAFDPTPDRDKTPDQNVPKPREDPKPQVFQPPDPPKEPVEPALDVFDEPADSDDSAIPPFVVGILIAVAGVAGVGALAAAPLLLISRYKAARRRRRRNHGPTADRFSGGWFEVVDAATDLGVVSPPGRTRQESAALLAAAFPSAGAVALARRADAGVFGPGDPPDEEVARLWTEVERVLGSMHAAVGRRQRLRARFSLKSIRNSSGSRPPSGSPATAVAGSPGGRWRRGRAGGLRRVGRSGRGAGRGDDR